MRAQEEEQDEEEARDEARLEDMREALQSLKSLKRLPQYLKVVRESKEIGMDAIELAGTQSLQKKINLKRRSMSVKIPKNSTKLKLQKEKYLEAKQKRQ